MRARYEVVLPKELETAEPASLLASEVERPDARR
jgi:hypothetical protein